MLYDKWKPFCFIKFEIIKNGIYRNAKENYMFTFDLRRKGCTAQHIIHTTLHTHIGLQSGWPQQHLWFERNSHARCQNWKFCAQLPHVYRISNVNELNHRTEPSCFFCQEYNNNNFQMKNYKYGTACTWLENWQARFSCDAPPPLFILI